MTPPARFAAAIGILDAYLSGAPLEKTLTNWGRRSRFAGSGDRAAIRDIVFDCVRSRLSFAALGGSETGRGLVLGYLVTSGQDPQLVFTGEGHAPAKLGPDELPGPQAKALEHVAMDMPHWLYDRAASDLGDEAEAIFSVMKSRAPVHLRVNLSRATLAQVIEKLAMDEITAEPHALCDTALTVTHNPRRVAQSQAWRDGLIELQDASSQAVCARLPLVGTMLDYCAGGGGKALAYADRAEAQIYVHDADPARMKDIDARAERAGKTLTKLDGGDVQTHAPYDLVLCDVPCSGSGAWRRTPEGKWALTEARLTQLCQIQAEIVQKASLYVAETGTLAYATCSLLKCENSLQKHLFLENNQDWRCCFERQFTPMDGGDGLYIMHLTRG